MAKTRTGGFGIGFRRGGGAWQKDVPALAAWATDNGFECIDVGRDGDRTAAEVVKAGLAVGTADLAEWQGMISPDKAKRREAVARNAAYVRACAAAGASGFFIVMLPEDPARKRKENFGYMVESFAELLPTMAECQARLAIEGWPGPGALCCTPESLREFFRQADSPAAGINYDPSHLIRMGIDPVRFLREFADRVVHLHGKDAELSPEALYECGHEQPPTFVQTPAFGSAAWRYCIPGHGQMRWLEAFGILRDAGYVGRVSIELEDANFNGSEEGEKLGLVLGRRFLESC